MKNELKGPFFILLSALCFGMSGTLQALAPEGATSLTVCLTRMAVGSLFLLGWCTVSGKIPAKLKGLPWKAFGACACLLCCSQALFFIGMRHVGVAVGSVVNLASIPIFSALIAVFFFKRPQTRAWYFATAVAVSGIVLVSGPGSGSVEKLFYISLPVIAAIFYSVYLVINQRLPRAIAPEAAMAFIMGIGALIYTPVLFFDPIDWVWSSTRGIVVSLCLGVFSSGLAFSFVLAGLRLTSTTTAATLGLAEPMIASCLGIFLLGEDSGPLTLLGIGLVFLAIVILVTGEARRGQRPSA